MPVFVGPPKPQYTKRMTWRYRCNAPTPGQNFLNGQRCGKDVTGWERDPMEAGAWRSEPWIHWEPGPWLRHLPCGHIWSLVSGEWVHSR